MKEHTNEKSLIELNENSIIYKIKRFFLNLFYRNTVNNNCDVSENTSNNTIENENRKNLFIEELKKVENEETKLLKLQKQYRSGEIKEEDLTDEQVKSLCKLYDKQIANLKESNLIKKQKILNYRKN